MIVLELPAAVQTIVSVLAQAGGRPLIVGGAVRDAALGGRPKDFDVEVYDLDPDRLVRALETAGKVNAVGVSFGVLKVVLSGLEIDVTLPRRESKAGPGHKGFLVRPDPTMTPQEAASRRDFTVNAMAFDPRTQETLDFFGGLRDLRERVLRHTGPAFSEDPLRVLRGLQFAGRFGLTAAAETVRLSRTLLCEYSTLSIERIWAEWSKWAAKSVAPSAGLVFLADSGWRAAYPELEALDGCPQDPAWHPEGDVWTHTLLVVHEAAAIAARDGLDEEDRLTLVLAALCHDLGKPGTTTTEEDRTRSPAHAAAEDTYRRFLARVGAPRRIADRVVALARHHLAHMGFTGLTRHARRLARGLAEGGESIEMLARLVEADHSGRSPLPKGQSPSMQKLLDTAREVAAANAAPGPILLGRHLVELGFAPGVEMGRILSAAYEAQLDGAFDSLEGAREWLRRRDPAPTRGPR